MKELKELIEADRQTEQTEPKQGTDCTQVDWKDEMWTEAVKDEPQTDCKECKYAWWNSDMKRYECSISRCPYNEQTEPQTERYCTNCKHNGVIEDYECRECCGMDHHEFIEPQTDCPWKWGCE